MHILVSNHAAEIAAFRSSIGDAAATLQVVENNLSALSLIGNRHDQIDSLVITEHQDQAVNVDTEVFVQNIVPRLLGSTDVLVIGALLSAAPGVQLVETIAEAAALVARQPAAVAAPTPATHTNGHAKTTIEDLERVDLFPSTGAPRGTKQRQNGASRTKPARTKAAEAPPALPSRPEAPPALPSRPEPAAVEATPAPPVAQTPVAEAAAAVETPLVAAPEAPLAAQNGAAAGDATAASPQEQIVTAQITPPPTAQRATPPTPDVALPQVMPEGPSGRPEIPESTRSLADDIRDWNERQDQQRGQSRGAEQRRQGFGDMLLGWLPANRRLRDQENELDAVIRQPRLTHCHSVAVISPKGGVGKSFLTYLVGNFLAEVRGDKVIAIDTNPDFGTLADQVRGREEQTVSTLLEQIRDIRHYSDLRRFTSKVESRLEVLAAPADPDMMASITANDYGQVFEQLHHYYDTVMFDCGTGFRDDITRFALQTADQIVLVSAPLFITTGIVIRAIGYLDQIGCDLSRVTLAINQVRREKPLDIDYMRSRFGSRLNAVVEIPFDMQLYQAMDRGEFSVEDTQQPTRIAVKQLVGELVRHFS